MIVCDWPSVIKIAHQAAHSAELSADGRDQSPTWLEQMKEEVDRNPRLRDALALTFYTPPALAALSPDADLEAFGRMIGERAEHDFKLYLHSPETQAQIRRQVLVGYVLRMRKLHGQQVTRKQIYLSLGIDKSDFAKYLNGKKFGPDSTVAQRINRLLTANDLPVRSKNSEQTEQARYHGRSK
jgi:hypothetical protein